MIPLYRYWPYILVFSLFISCNNDIYIEPGYLSANWKVISLDETGNNYVKDLAGDSNGKVAVLTHSDESLLNGDFPPAFIFYETYQGVDGITYHYFSQSQYVENKGLISIYKDLNLVDEYSYQEFPFLHDSYGDIQYDNNGVLSFLDINLNIYRLTEQHNVDTAQLFFLFPLPSLRFNEYLFDNQNVLWFKGKLHSLIYVVDSVPVRYSPLGEEILFSFCLDSNRDLVYISNH